jgi:hypothetical protein
MPRSKQCITEELGWPSGLWERGPRLHKVLHLGFPRDTIPTNDATILDRQVASNLSVLETRLRQRDHTVSQQGSCGCSCRISCAANIQLGMAEQTKTWLEEANIYINALNNPTLPEDHSCLHSPSILHNIWTSWTCRASMLEIALAIQLRMSN